MATRTAHVGHSLLPLRQLDKAVNVPCIVRELLAYYAAYRATEIDASHCSRGPSFKHTKSLLHLDVQCAGSDSIGGYRSHGSIKGIDHCSRKGGS
jgi:hypothetical protein